MARPQAGLILTLKSGYFNNHEEADQLVLAELSAVVNDYIMKAGIFAAKLTRFVIERRRSSCLLLLGVSQNTARGCNDAGSKAVRTELLCGASI